MIIYKYLKNLNASGYNELRKTMKNLLNQITNSLTYRGIKKGLEVPTLPDNIYKAYNHIFVRIFRVIGGICLLLVLSQKYTVFPNFMH